jgi:4a-hydroxytetrahydrobiopterin dehydratase
MTRVASGQVGHFIGGDPPVMTVDAGSLLSPTVRFNCCVVSGMWREEDGALRREFVFVDFAAAWAFMTEVARVAEQHDHHPDWSNSWNRVSIALRSHDVGRVTARDHRMAEEIDRLVSGTTVGEQ